MSAAAEEITPPNQRNNPPMTGPTPGKIAVAMAAPAKLPKTPTGNKNANNTADNIFDAFNARYFAFPPTSNGFSIHSIQLYMTNTQ